MGTAIRKHLRDFVAVAALLVVALVVTVYIVENQRLRIPVFEEKPFELKAEFETAQAVVPGQGQTIRVAGVRIGDVSDVAVEDGVGVVTFEIERKFLPVYKDATVLMRPTTGLKDMFFELDPGSEKAGEFDEGDTIPVVEHRPRRQPRRDPRGARLRHAGLPEAAARRRRQGARRPRRGPRQAARLGRADQQGPGGAQPRGRPAQGEPRPADPQLQPADDDRRPVRPGPDRARLGLQRRPRRDRRAGPERAARGQPAAGHAHPGDRDARPHRAARRRARPGGRRPAPVRAQPRPAQRLDPPARRAGDPRAPERDPPVRAGRAAPGPRPAQGRRALLGRDAGPDDGGQEDQPARQHGRLQPQRGRAARDDGSRRGLPLLARLARPQRRLGVLGRRRQRLLPPHLLHDRLRPDLRDRPLDAAGRGDAARDRHRASPPTNQNLLCPGLPSSPNSD